MASPSEAPADAVRALATHDEPLYAMEELAQIGDFCRTFQAPLKLPLFSRTDLQAALVAGTRGDDRQVALLAELHFKLVREQGAKLERMIQDWEKAVMRKVTDNWRLEFSSNPFDGAAYDDLTAVQRVQVLNALCHWKLESCAEIQKYLLALQKEADSKALEALRSTPIGYDDAGATYWYFGDCCWVYAEDRPEWQSQCAQEYAVEFADAKRIRLSINFDPKRSATPLPNKSSAHTEAVEAAQTNGKALEVLESTVNDKMQITSLVEEQIDDDDEEDQPLPAHTASETKETMKTEVSESTSTEVPPLEEAQAPSRKMDITMLCGSPSTAESSPKPEPMEEDEHDVSEDRFMSTIVSTRDPVKGEPQVEDINAVSQTEYVKTEIQPEDLKSDKRESKQETERKAGEAAVEDGPPEMKKRRMSDEEVDLKNDKKSVDAEAGAPPKRRKTRFHDIIRASDNTLQPLVDKKDDNTVVELKVETGPVTSINPVQEPSAVQSSTETAAPESVGQDQDFDIVCEACQRSYDRRYLDPPLDHRPVGEWRCFECLVNDARGWPRRRNPPAKSPKGSNIDGVEDTENVASHKKSSSSSRRSKSKSSSSSSTSKSSSKKKSSSRSSSSSHKKGSSSKKSSKKHKKSSSSKSHSSSSSSRHHSSSRHKEEYAKLVKLAQGRKRERLAIEKERLNGAHLCPVSLDGPTGWRVVCSSVEGLRQVIGKLAGGSLEQDRLRGRLISILKTEEKMEVERLKKREQQLWQVLPRRQSSRVAISRIKNQNSGDSVGESEEEQDEHRDTQRSSRLRGTTNGHDSRERLARDRESRARRRRAVDDSESDAESEDDDVGSQVRSVAGWINWKHVHGDGSLALVCSGVIDRLLKEEISELFARPVDPEEDGCPDYLTVIEQPMDLGTIRKRVNAGFYTGWDLFKTDVDRVWKNCRKYNSPDTVVVEYADALDEMFKQMRKEAEKKGVRKMGKLDPGADGKDTDPAQVDDDDEALQESSDDENVKGNSKSDSSASEVSSEESDDSSEANSDDDDEDRPSKRKTRTRTSTKVKPASRTSSRPSRSSRATTSSSSKQRSSRRKSKGSDSEEEEAESGSDSEEDEDMELSDDSDEVVRGRSSRSRPRRGAQASSTRVNARATRAPSPPSAVGAKQLEEPRAKAAPGRRNRIDDSSDSSSSDDSMKRDDSSSSSDSDDGDDNEKVSSQTPAAGASTSGQDATQTNRQQVAAAAPPPPSSPPPPPPPSSAATTPGSNRKPSASSRSRASPTGLLNPYQSPGSSSSYFSSSESESSAGGSDTSDSE